MAENENVLTEEHPFGIEPETYSELETNHPKLYKNTESGTSTVPTGNPFDGETGGGVEYETRELIVTNSTSAFIGLGFTSNANGKIRFSMVNTLSKNKTKIFKPIASQKTTTQYTAQYIVLSADTGSISTITSNIDGVEFYEMPFSDTKSYYLLKIPATEVKDITITIN